MSRYKNSEIKDETREHRKSFLREGTLVEWSQTAYDIAFREGTQSSVDGTISNHARNHLDVRKQALSALSGSSNQHVGDSNVPHGLGGAMLMRTVGTAIIANQSICDLFEVPPPPPGVVMHEEDNGVQIGR